jgi:RNA polymerase sigma-70 factor (ECF subfamily)
MPIPGDAAPIPVGRPTVDRSEWPSLSDDDVVRRVLAGDTPLFEVLMRRYNQRLFRVARAVLKDPDEAEDVMQHAYVRAFEHLGQFEGRARFATWLTKIALYEALGRARKRDQPRRADSGSAERSSIDALESADPDPEQQALQGEARSVLETSIGALPPAYRMVFVMREVEGLDTAETAECLEVSEDVVKTRLRRARVMLRRALLARAGVAAASAFSFHLSRCDRVVTRVLEQITTRVH